jgi:tetratricopeptide (TPR) repeat protein
MHLDCRLPGPRFRLGRLALEQNKNNEAFGFLASELELDIQQSEVLQSIGLMMTRLGKIDYAIHCFLKVSELESANGINYLYLAKAIALRGEFDESEQFLDYAIELEPKNPVLAAEAAKTYLAMKNPRKALFILTTCRRGNRGFLCGLFEFSIRSRIFLLEMKERFTYLMKRFVR